MTSKTEIMRIGPPYDEHPTFPPDADPEYYSESRGIGQIESEMMRRGFPFSFKDQLLNLSKQFPGDEPLRVFDSGCGHAFTLKEIKELGTEVGRRIETIGLTMALRHIPSAERASVDRLIVGRIEDFKPSDDLSERVHFLIDYFGPTKGDAQVEGGVLHEGRNTIPIYSSFLVNGGLAFITMFNLSEGILGDNGRRERAVGLIKENGFRIIGGKDCLALLQKSNA